MMPASPFSRIWLGLFGLVILLCMFGVEAGSRAPKPIKRIYHPRTISLDVIPRSIPSHPGKSPRKRSELPSHHLLSSDALRLSLSLPKAHSDLEGEEDLVHLHLQPTEFLIHQQAKLNILNGEGKVTSTRPLFRDEDGHKLYSGEVISAEKSDRRLQEDKLGGLWYHPLSGPERGVRGWASIHVYDDGRGGAVPTGKPKFAGAIQVDGKVWHVLTKENYLRHKGEFDPEVVEESEDGEIVVFLEGDVKPEQVHGLQSGGVKEYETCGHDKNEWNRNASIHQGSKVDRFNTPSPWWLPSSDMTYPDLSPNPETDFTFGSSSSFPNPNLHHRHSSLKIKRQADTPTGGTATPSTNYINNIGQTQGCPTEQRIVYVGMVADSNYVRVYGSEEAARTQILTNMNSVSTLYRQTFNISLGVIEINVISNTSSQASSLAFNQGCSNAYTLNQRLSDFSAWRGSQSSDAGLYHLMTACGTDSEIGVAWLGAVCQTGSSSQPSGTVSGTGVSVAMRSEWSLNAHEMGHNFGAIHDCWDGCSLQGSCCPRSSDTCNAGGGYIMNPSTSADNAQVAFSPCSVGNICSLMQARALDYSCMESPGSRTVLSLQSCGNGILEDGEDCDPGQNATSNCCDAATCKFINGAVCDPATDLCCTDQCGYASNTTLCRPATDERCDIAEYCTGNSRSCPADETQDDGTSCGDNGLSCASGQCTSNDVQCQTVGASYNLTRACGQRNDRSCVVSCQQGSNQCLQLPTPLIDGSPCGYGGKCYNGTCHSGSAGSTVSNWYRQNLNIAIPVTIVAGILVLLFAVLIVRCIWRGCCGGTPRKQRRSSNSQRRASRAAAGASYASTAPMRQSQNYGYGQQGYPQQAYQPPPSHPSRQSQYGQYGQYGQPAQYDQYGQYNQGHYGGGGGVPPPPPARPGRDHYVDDSLYNGPNYRE